jgi:hypothetical protein
MCHLIEWQALALGQRLRRQGEPENDLGYHPGGAKSRAGRGNGKNRRQDHVAGLSGEALLYKLA